MGRNLSQSRQGILLLFFLAGANWAQQPCSAPYTVEQLVELLRNGVLPLRVRTLVMGRGVSFTLGEEDERRLWEAGAGDLLIEAIREKSSIRFRSSAPVRAGEFVRVEPGEFLMGCGRGDSACQDDERPPRQVRITAPFEIARHEVTQAEWEAVMGDVPSRFKGAQLPVEGVSWEDAQQYLNRLNARQDGYRYRLPTEAQWEYAARADGRETGGLEEIGWFAANSAGQTQPVGRKSGNGWGLHDMLGNVWEWCEDWYDAAAQQRAVRGGSWFDPPRYLRVSNRLGLKTGTRIDSVGFRVVREKGR